MQREIHVSGHAHDLLISVRIRQRDVIRFQFRQFACPFTKINLRIDLIGLTADSQALQKRDMFAEDQHSNERDGTLRTWAGDSDVLQFRQFELSDRRLADAFHADGQDFQ